MQKEKETEEQEVAWAFREDATKEIADYPKIEEDLAKIQIPILLNLETMFDELIHEPDFIEEH